MMKTLKNEKEKYSYLLSTKDCCRCSPECGGVRYAKSQAGFQGPFFWFLQTRWDVWDFGICNPWYLICDMWYVIYDSAGKKAKQGLPRGRLFEKQTNWHDAQQRDKTTETTATWREGKKNLNQLVFCNLRTTKNFLQYFKRTCCKHILQMHRLE